MRCFNHTEQKSIGVCKNCGRGVCKECDPASNMLFLSCSTHCVEQNIALDEMTKKTEKFYKIGRYKKTRQKIISTNSATYFIMSILLFIIPLWMGMKSVNTSTFPICIVLFLTGCFVGWKDYKRDISI